MKVIANAENLPGPTSTSDFTILEHTLSSTGNYLVCASIRKTDYGVGGGNVAWQIHWVDSGVAQSLDSIDDFTAGIPWPSLLVRADANTVLKVVASQHTPDPAISNAMRFSAAFIKLS